MAYSEGLFLLLAASTMLAVTRRRWLLGRTAAAPPRPGPGPTASTSRRCSGVAAVVAVVHPSGVARAHGAGACAWGLVAFMVYGGGAADAGTRGTPRRSRAGTSATTSRRRRGASSPSPRPFAEYWHNEYIVTCHGAGAVYLLRARGAGRWPGAADAAGCWRSTPSSWSRRCWCRPGWACGHASCCSAFPLMAVPARALWAAGGSSATACCRRAGAGRRRLLVRRPGTGLRRRRAAGVYLAARLRRLARTVSGRAAATAPRSACARWSPG